MSLNHFYMNSIDPVLQEYIDITVQIKALEKRKAEIAEEAINTIEDHFEGGREYRTPLGVFTVGSRKSWNYSSKVKDAADALANMKKNEEHDGTAELVKHSSWPIFTPFKGGKNG